MRPTQLTLEELAANVALAKAAPAMLAACKRVLRAIEWAETADRMEPEEQAALLRAVIDKAESRS
jgi:hypothetical protein